MLGSSTAQVRTTISRGVRALADVLFPPACPVCGTSGVDAPDWVCVPCDAAIERQCRNTYCPTCARTVPPFAVSDGRCHRCRERKVRITAVVRAGLYVGPLAAVLRAFKYRRRWTLAAYLGHRVAAEFDRTSWFQSVDALVTVLIGLLFAMDPDIGVLLKGLVMMAGVFANRLPGVGPVVRIGVVP